MSWTEQKCMGLTRTQTKPLAFRPPRLSAFLQISAVSEHANNLE